MSCADDNNQPRWVLSQPQDRITDRKKLLGSEILCPLATALSLQAAVSWGLCSALGLLHPASALGAPLLPAGAWH